MSHQKGPVEAGESGEMRLCEGEEPWLKGWNARGAASRAGGAGRGPRAAALRLARVGGPHGHPPECVVLARLLRRAAVRGAAAGRGRGPDGPGFFLGRRPDF